MASKKNKQANCGDGDGNKREAGILEFFAERSGNNKNRGSLIMMQKIGPGIIRSI